MSLFLENVPIVNFSVSGHLVSAYVVLLVLHLLYWLLCLCHSVHLLMLLQLHSVQAAFANGGATQVRSFAKDAAPADRPPVGGDGKLLTLLFCVSYWLKNCFGHVSITIMYMCLNSN